MPDPHGQGPIQGGKGFRRRALGAALRYSQRAQEAQQGQDSCTNSKSNISNVLPLPILRLRHCDHRNQLIERSIQPLGAGVLPGRRRLYHSCLAAIYHLQTATRVATGRRWVRWIRGKSRHCPDGIVHRGRILGAGVKPSPVPVHVGRPEHRMWQAAADHEKDRETGNHPERMPIQAAPRGGAGTGAGSIRTTIIPFRSIHLKHKGEIKRTPGPDHPVGGPFRDIIQTLV